MKKIFGILLILFFAFPVCCAYSAWPINDGSEEDEDCAVITDWTDGDAVAGTAESTQKTYDGCSYFGFNTFASASGNDYARRYKDVGSIESLGDTFSVSIKLYHVNIGSRNDSFFIQVERSDMVFFAYFQSDGLKLSDSEGSYTEVGTNIVVEDSWQTWTFIVDVSNGVANATCDVYLGTVKQGDDIDCSYTGNNTDGKVSLWQMGIDHDDQLSFVDWLLIGDSGASPEWEHTFIGVGAANIDSAIGVSLSDIENVIGVD